MELDTMNVGEIKSLIPKAEVHELRSDARYLIRIPSSTSPQLLNELRQRLLQAGLRGLIIASGDIRFYELRDDDVSQEKPVHAVPTQPQVCQRPSPSAAREGCS